MPMLEDMLRRALDNWDRLRRHYFRGVLARRIPQAQAEHHEILAQIRDRDLVALEQHDSRAQSGRARLVLRLSRLGRPRPRVSERYLRVAALKTADAFARHLAAVRHRPRVRS